MYCSAHLLHLVVGGVFLLKGKERESAIVDDDESDNMDDDIHLSGNLSFQEDETKIFVDSSTSLGISLPRSWWIDDRLEELERSDNTEHVDSQFEPSEWISDVDIDDLCKEVASFVSFVEKSSADKVSSSDIKYVRKTVQGFRKLSTFFHHTQKGSNRLNNLQFDKTNPLEVMSDCPTRWNSTQCSSDLLNYS